MRLVYFVKVDFMGDAIVPDFLIIGAMKAGTTTLYRDLLRHPKVFLPAAKEPEVLVQCPRIRDAYATYSELFKQSRPIQKRGEASTAYTKRPTYEGVAQRAFAVCGPKTRIVYMRRDPIERIISHYKHDLQRGFIDGTFAEVVTKDSRLIDYTRYEWQIEPWIDVFGKEAVLQIKLEEYAHSRQSVAERVIEHIGLCPKELPMLDPRKIANRAEEAKRVDNFLLFAFQQSSLYQNLLRPLLSADTRERLRHLVLPTVTPSEIELPSDILSYIERELSKEIGSAAET